MFFRTPTQCYSANVLPSGATFEVESRQTVLDAALAAGIDFPFNCQVGACKSCACRITKGEVRCLTDLNQVFGRADIEDGYTLACQTLPQSDITISLDTSAANYPENNFVSVDAVYERLTNLTPRVFKSYFKLTRSLDVKAGQYAYICVPEIDTLRPFSFASIEKQKHGDIISFDITRIPKGRISSWLTDLKNIGKPLSIQGPLGDFWLRDGDSPLLCIAGGSGMGAMLAIIRDGIRRSPRRRFVYLYAAKSESDLYGLEEIQFLQENPAHRITFLPILSNQPQRSGWQGLRGHIADILRNLPALVKNYQWSEKKPLSDWQCLLCGPVGLIDTSLPTLRSLGVNNKDIYYDKFTPNVNVPLHISSGRS